MITVVILARRYASEWCVLQSMTSSLSASMTSHLQSLGVASVNIHQLLERATNLSAALPTDDVTAMTSSLVDETYQLVLSINATPISADHVTEMYRTAETGRQTAELALNASQSAVYVCRFSCTS